MQSADTRSAVVVVNNSLSGIETRIYGKADLVVCNRRCHVRSAKRERRATRAWCQSMAKSCPQIRPQGNRYRGRRGGIRIGRSQLDRVRGRSNDVIAGSILQSINAATAKGDVVVVDHFGTVVQTVVIQDRAIHSTLHGVRQPSRGICSCSEGHRKRHAIVGEIQAVITARRDDRKVRGIDLTLNFGCQRGGVGIRSVK